jgi:hypothetical protein
VWSIVSTPTTGKSTGAGATTAHTSAAPLLSPVTTFHTAAAGSAAPLHGTCVAVHSTSSAASSAVVYVGRSDGSVLVLDLTTSQPRAILQCTNTNASAVTALLTVPLSALTEAAPLSAISCGGAAAQTARTAAAAAAAAAEAVLVVAGHKSGALSVWDLRTQKLVAVHNFDSQITALALAEDRIRYEADSIL